MVASETLSNVAEFTVSELSASLKRTVEDNFGYVRVRGELGKVTHHSNGHIYLDLKDEKACLAGVIWRGSQARLKIKPEMGMEVIVTGRITTYAPQSKYQITIESLEPAGLGALMALLEERRKKFAAEGLFDEARKKKLPRLPLTIGIITSPTGAVIRDMLHRIADRFPVRVLIWPVRVQGEEAPQEVARAIQGFSAGEITPKPDLLIVARGGGSLEDLWAFNEEIVVRAAANCIIPLISAIGHETDWTLLDHVADLRAPTPTAAIELALPVRQDLIVQISQINARILRAVLAQYERLKKNLEGLRRALPKLDAIMALPRQKLDHAHEKLGRTAQALFQEKRLQLASRAQGLSLPMLKQRLKRWHELIVAQHSRMALSMRIEVRRQRTALNNFEKLLRTLSYRNVLARGYAVVRADNDIILTRAAQLQAGQRLILEFADNRVTAQADDKAKKPPQADLFGGRQKKR
jgi:exodeoxyribonuclease VII large subunit